MTEHSKQNETITPPEDNAAENMETLGSRFQKQRQHLNKTIEDAAERTRILPATLKALEENNRDALPADVFTRGFIKLYAQYLDLDPDQALIWFEDQEANSNNGLQYSDLQSSDFDDNNDTASDSAQISLGRLMIFTILALLIVFAGYLILSDNEKSSTPSFVRQLEQETNHTTGQPVPPDTSAVENKQPAAEISNLSSEQKVPESKPQTKDEDESETPASATAVEAIDPLSVVPTIKKLTQKPSPGADNEAVGLKDNQQPPAETATIQPLEEEHQKVEEIKEILPDTTSTLERKEQQPKTAAIFTPTYNYVLRAEVIEMTWLRIKIDGKKSREYTYQPGDKVVWKADQRISLFVGNAGGLRLTLNDQLLPPLGKSGKTARRTFPSQPDQ